MNKHIVRQLKYLYCNILILLSRYISS